MQEHAATRSNLVSTQHARLWHCSPAECVCVNFVSRLSTAWVTAHLGAEVEAVAEQQILPLHEGGVVQVYVADLELLAGRNRLEGANLQPALEERLSTVGPAGTPRLTTSHEAQSRPVQPKITTGSRQSQNYEADPELK